MSDRLSSQSSTVMIPEAQYNVARDGYFEALRQRDRYREALRRVRRFVSIHDVKGKDLAIIDKALYPDG